MNYRDFNLKCSDEISDLEINSFISFNEELDNCKTIKRIYRGDKIQHPSEIRFYFIVGDKGKYFERSEKKESNDFNEVSKKVFEKIHELILVSFESERNIRDESNLEDSFKNFFNEISSENFWLVIEKLNSRQMLLIRDYYLRYLHQFAITVQHKNSFFLSASYEYNLAMQKFALYKSSENLCPIVIHSWITQPYYQFVFDSENKSNSVNKILEESKLPSYNIFQEEKEVTFKGGVLPHYILGIEEINEDGRNNFHINPAYFKKENQNKNSVIKNGFEIDQSNFQNVLLLTQFEKSFVVIDGETLF